jgi:hypothetical protein
MSKESINFNQKYYNIFSICQEFRQRLEELQRLRKQDIKKKDVNKKQ